jgi:hypothetical protein
MSLLGSEELVDSWWQSPNIAMGMSTPSELWTKDEMGRDFVFTYIKNQVDYQGS